MTLETQPLAAPSVSPEEWEPPMPPTDLIFDDGEPLETNRHRIAMNTLIRSVEQGFASRQDFFVGGNMFIYFSSEQARNRDFRGPDFFAVLNIEGGGESRQGWVVWEEGGRYPDVIIELMSSSTAAIDLTVKKELYQNTFRTADYFVYNPFDPSSLQGWHLNSSQIYQPLIPNENGWLWCEKLEYWLGLWSGRLTRETAVWARFYTTDGELVPLPEEAARQEVDIARQEVDIAQQQADIAQQEVDIAQQQADMAEQRAITAERQAEIAQQQAEIAQQQAEIAQQQAEMAKEEGERQGALRQLQRMLTLRFGELPQSFESPWQAASLPEIEAAIEVALIASSWDEFLNSIE